MFDVIYEDITNIISKFSIPICLIGDFNSRTGELDDILHIESEIINHCNLNDIASDIFPLNSLNEFPTVNIKRHNEDKNTNRNGELLIELCKSLNFRIVNGRIGLDKGLGAITFDNNIGKSTIDYVIASSDFFQYISTFEVDILDQNLSDFHCPIILSLNAQIIEINTLVYEDPLASNISFTPIHSKWDRGKILEYQSNFEPNRFNNLLNMLEKLETDGPNQHGLDEAVKELCKLYLNPAIKIGISKSFVPKSNHNYRSRKINKPGFDRECRERRKRYFRIRKKLKNSQSHRDSLILKTEAKMYKKFIKHKMNLFCKNIHHKLRLLKSKNPKEYWNILNISKNNNTHSMHINNFYDHFKELNENNVENLNDFDMNSIMTTNNDVINSDFTLDEINNLANKLKCNKANGIDNVINEFIRFSPIEVRFALVSLFNIILNSGIVPEDWCISLRIISLRIKVLRKMQTITGGYH
ncbi:unnamed protein product [Meganyctiphanes norvegica]|uniref:Endonuclease/exonuclease/phosphatase domain-containing protein n=1 Tax=Meganyctiphanes norvegica TaxID=48144 RepID=A0AAV2QKQ9_MEGNR